MQLYSDDDEVEKAFSGENVKIKLKNVEEEVDNDWWHVNGYRCDLYHCLLLHIAARNWFS